MTAATGQVLPSDERAALQFENTAISGRHVCDVLVAGSGAGGFADGADGAQSRARRSDGREGRAIRRHHGLLGRLDLDSGQRATCRTTRSAVDVRARTRLPCSITSVTGSMPSRVDAFLAAGPRMLAMFAREGFVDFLPAPAFSDYYPDGARRLAGRPLTLVPGAYDGTPAWSPGSTSCARQLRRCRRSAA